MCRIVAVAVALAAVCCPVGHIRADAAQAAAPAGAVASTRNPTEVVVEASRIDLERQVTNFVTTVTGRVFEDNPARWQRSVCPLVAGLSRDQGEFVLHRISDVARAAGAPLGARQCRPNLLIVATQDPRATLEAWRKHTPGLFSSQSPPKIQRFLDTQRPIRVWYNMKHIGADGTPLVKWAGRNNGQLTDMGRLPNTRLEHGSVKTLETVIVIVDGSRIAGMRVSNLADYVAMVSLVELQLDQDFTGIPTVLASAEQAASTGTASRELTAWDRALLSGVYGTEQKHKLQRTQVVQHMLREVAGTAPNAAAVASAGN